MTLTLCGNSACDAGFDPIEDILWYIGTMLVLSVLPNWLLIIIQPIRVPKTAKVAYILTLNGLFKSELIFEKLPLIKILILFV